VGPLKHRRSRSDTSDVARAEDQPDDSDVYIPVARLRSAFYCSLAALICFSCAGALANFVSHQTHLPSRAGGPVAALCVTGLALLGVYAARAALRGARSGVTVDPRGITIHNPTNDLRIPWSDITRFETTKDTGGTRAGEAIPYTVARVVLRDGSSHMIEATRLAGAIWGRHPTDKVQQCVVRLNSLLEDATARGASSPAASLTPTPR
jgi:hypothetical protein